MASKDRTQPKPFTLLLAGRLSRYCLLTGVPMQGQPFHHCSAFDRNKCVSESGSVALSRLGQGKKAKARLASPCRYRYVHLSLTFCRFASKRDLIRREEVRYIGALYCALPQWRSPARVVPHMGSSKRLWAWLPEIHRQVKYLRRTMTAQ